MAKIAALIVLLVSLVSTGCQGPPPEITIENANVQFSRTMKNEANVFLKIINKGGEDKLLGAQVSIAGATTEILQTQGMMTKIIVKELIIPAHETLELNKWGSNIVIQNLPADLGPGAKFTLTLVFEKSGRMPVPLTFTMARPRPGQPTMFH